MAVIKWTTGTLCEQEGTGKMVKETKFQTEERIEADTILIREYARINSSAHYLEMCVGFLKRAGSKKDIKDLELILEAIDMIDNLTKVLDKTSLRKSWLPK